jgi:hypothetical protein
VVATRGDELVATKQFVLEESIWLAFNQLWMGPCSSLRCPFLKLLVQWAGRLGQDRTSRMGHATLAALICELEKTHSAGCFARLPQMAILRELFRLAWKSTQATIKYRDYMLKHSTTQSLAHHLFFRGQRSKLQPRDPVWIPVAGKRRKTREKQ